MANEIAHVCVYQPHKSTCTRVGKYFARVRMADKIATEVATPETFFFSTAHASRPTQMTQLFAIGLAREVLLLLLGALAFHPLVARCTFPEVPLHVPLVMAAAEHCLASRAGLLLSSVLCWEPLISSCFLLARHSLGTLPYLACPLGWR